MFGSPKKACYAPGEEWWVFSQMAACVKVELARSGIRSLKKKILSGGGIQSKNGETP